MRFTSLIVELIRARPRLVVWVVLLVQAAIWLALPVVLYDGPPGGLATVLAIGREYRVGTPDGPPLAYWLADIAFRAAGNHLAGVYLAAQLCVVAAFWALYRLGRAIVGGPHAALAVLLTMAVMAFGAPTVAFGPNVLALAIWSHLLWQAWRVIGERRRTAWFALAFNAGLLVLTTAAAPALLALLLAVMLASPRGRRSFSAPDPLYALPVLGVIVMPFAIWLMRNGWPPAALPTRDAPVVAALSAMRRLGELLAAMTGMIVLTMMNTGRLVRVRDNAPVIARAGLDPLGRSFVLIVALVPAVVGCLVSGLYGWPEVAGGASIALLPSGLAVVVLAQDVIPLRQQPVLRKIWALAVIAPAVLAVAIVLVLPWIGGAEHDTTIPARSIAKFFDESYRRRTGKPLQAVAGDPDLAAVVALGAARPHLLLDAQPERTPWLTARDLIDRGGVVLWRATDTIGAPPPDIAQRFPGLVPEVPRGFDRLVNGRLPPLRIGWAIIRGKAM